MGEMINGYLFLKNVLSLFIFDKDRMWAWAGEGQKEREGDTESKAGSRLQAVSTEPDVGLKPMNREITTCA